MRMPRDISTDGPTKVFLLDDHEVVRRGVKDLINQEDDLTVVGEAGSVAEAIAAVAASRPDVAVLDVQLEDGTGIEVCRDIRSAYPEVRCMMLTSFSDDEALLDSIVAGAAGYVLKQIRGNELVTSIRRVAAGQMLHDATTRERAIERLRRAPDEDHRLASLTPQERKILVLLTEGLTNRQIGERMSLAEKTVKNYITNLLAKLGMKRRTEAAVYAARSKGLT